ncbi:MAG: methionine--tRNA ligase [Halobacteriales archaeon]
MERAAFPTDAPAVVTCGLPYANGELHIGHMRTFLSGDTIARALRLVGQETAFVSGSDMHGTPVSVNAHREGVDPETFAMRWHERYESVFPKLRVEFDNYGHTHDETNQAVTTEIVRALDEAGHIYDREIQVAWDPVLEMPLPDRYVEGTCPYCGAHARGDECDEGCGRHLEPGEIVDPISVETGEPAEYRTRSHKFFRLSDFQDYLEGFLDRLEGTDNAKNQPREWIEGELRDWCITRDLDWGIPYPDDGAEDLVLYVWVDAPIEYISSTRQYAERTGAFDWERAWREDGEIVHVIGRDIIQHHTVFWPAMLHGSGYGEPRAVLASGFINLDGRAFSTSRNRAVWVNEYLEAGFDPDYLRYYLLSYGQFQQDIDFTWSRFAEVVNNDLANDLGNFAYRSMLFAYRNYDEAPAAPVSDEVRERIEAAVDDIAAALNGHEPRRLAQAPVALARFGNEYIQRTEPWHLVEEDPEAAAVVIGDCLQLVKAIAVVGSPVLPGLAPELWGQLPGDEPIEHVEDALEPVSGELKRPDTLVEQIEDEAVEALERELEERIEPAEPVEAVADGAEADDLEPLLGERISIQRFRELDLRVGEILSAEPIEGADELVALTVDLGLERRQIVAGIKPFYDLDALPGQRVIVVANLERAEIFGVESNGMVLAAGEEADLLTTVGDAPLGSRVL